MKRGILITTVLAVAIIVLLCYVYGGAGYVPSGQPPLTSLNADNFSTLKTQFNASRDSTRVILLLSPT